MSHLADSPHKPPSIELILNSDLKLIKNLPFLEAKDMRAIAGAMALAVILLFSNLVIPRLVELDSTDGAAFPYGELSPEVRLILGHLQTEENNSERMIAAEKSVGAEYRSDGVVRMMRVGFWVNLLNY